MKHYHPEDSVVCSVIAIVCTLLSQTCMGHEECVHMAITKSATESSASLTAFLTDNFGASCAPFESVPLLRLSHGPIGWMVQGSFNEDDRPRSIKHFYTVRPQRPPVAGLTDAIPYAETDSFTWGAIRGGGGPIEKQPWSWQNARDYAYAALTSPLESQRFDNFADLFFALGHVLHLCQDLAQPDHVRNDAHPIKKLRWIENHGAANYEKKKGIWLQPHPHGWPYWRSKGFTKLQDFWDRGKYKGDDEQLIAALDKDKTADGDEKLGLAEFCNGNFLGEDATYAEHFTPGDQHYFPFPRVRRMQSFKDYQGNLPANVRMTFVRNGDSVYRIPIKKDKDGPTVNAHSMLLYLGTMPQFDAYTRPVAYVSSTINESAVLDEYHSILLPKAVEYSAGILDYFFRGKLEVSTVTLNANCGYDLAIKNLSGQDFRGGEFRLYWDDQSGNRTRLLDPGSPTAGSFSLAWSQSSTLGDNQTVVAIFKPPTGVTVAKYTLVYRGIIGSDGSGAPVDPVERESMGNDLAIATQSFGPVCMPLCLGLTWTFSDSTVQSITVDVPAGCSAAEIHIHLGGVWGECPLPSGSYAGASVEVDNEVLWYHDGMDDLTFNLTVPFSLSAGSHTLILAASHGLPVRCGTPTVSGTVIWR